MLRGQQVALRARVKSDVEILHPALHDDPSLWSVMRSEPWTPISAESEDSPYLPFTSKGKEEMFTVVTLADDEVVGHALLWSIDSHNRSAHIGLGLVPEARGRGFGSDITRVLCHYGFVLRGLRRLQVDTLASNAAMIGAAKAVGFELEGTLRAAAYVEGEIRDEVVMGLLAEDYRP